MLNKFLILIFLQGFLISLTFSQDKNSHSSIEVEATRNKIIELINQSDSLIKNNVLNEEEFLHQIYLIAETNQKEINIFKARLNNIYVNIINRIPPKEERQNELDSLKREKISAIPELYQVIHYELQALLNGWMQNKSLPYTVSAGDNLWSIAKQIDSTLSWLRIYHFNKDRIKNPNHIFPQQTLLLPYFKIIEDSSIAEVVDTLGNNILQQNIDEQKTVVKERNDEIEIEGLIVDATQTKIGHDFYDTFYSNWQAPINFSDFTITINEKPLPRLGTQISITVNDTEIFQRFLQPRFEIIEEMAQEGVAITLSFLENYEQIQQELQGDDLRGSGIF